MVLSNITPGADFRTGEGELFEQGERILKKYEEANKTNLIRRAQQRGTVEGAAVADGAPMPERGFLFLRLKVSSWHQLVGASAGHRTGRSLALGLVPVFVILTWITKAILTPSQQQQNQQVSHATPRTCSACL